MEASSIYGYVINRNFKPYDNDVYRYQDLDHPKFIYEVENMRKVLLSEKNIGLVKSRLERFFFNPKYGYEMHHNFDCGYKNIKPYGQKSNGENVDRIDIGFESRTNKPFIRIVFQDGISYGILKMGSIIVFRGGNEIITQEKWIFTDAGNYVYTVYRLKPLTENDKLKIAMERAFEKSMADDYWAEQEREMFCDDDDLDENCA